MLCMPFSFLESTNVCAFVCVWTNALGEALGERQHGGALPQRQCLLEAAAVVGQEAELEAGEEGREHLGFVDVWRQSVNRVSTIYSTLVQTMYKSIFLCFTLAKSSSEKKRRSVSTSCRQSTSCVHLFRLCIS